MQFEDVVKTYLRSFEKEYRQALADGQHTPELSFRISLHSLFENLAVYFVGRNKVTVVLEPKNQNRAGRPDWRIHDSKTLGVFGYVEGKGLTLDEFDYSVHAEQFERYLALGHKLAITDGIEFAYQFPGDQSISVVSIIDKKALRHRNWATNPINPKFQLFAQSLFATPAPVVCGEEELVGQIAIRARCLADEIEEYKGIVPDEAIDDEERENVASVIRLHDAVCGSRNLGFRTDRAFAEYVAQGIMFDLWCAHRRLCSIEDDAVVKEAKLLEYTSAQEGQHSESGVLHDLLMFACADEDSFVLEWIKECISYLSFVHVTDEFRANPDYKRLYESFLLRFNRAARFDYGAYFTPDPVASCVVSLANCAAKEVSGRLLSDDDNGWILDPCCGTASFLESAIDSGVSPNRVAGFEILPAPYALAEYRLKNNYCGGDGHDNAPHLYLVNSLSDSLYEDDQETKSLRANEEINAGELLKNSRITAIVCSPPCSEAYRPVTQEPIDRIRGLVDELRPRRRGSRSNLERQINNTWLQFYRWNCSVLEANEGLAILALILPSSFLENDSFTPARRYLLDHYSDVYVLEIDGAARSGIRADNIFYTQQGRCIVVAARGNLLASDATVHHLSVVQLRREMKNEYLSGFDASELENFTSFKPTESIAYSFCPPQEFDEKTYSQYWPLRADEEPSVFRKDISGIKLSPVSLFVHAKNPMLRRRTREVARNIDASTGWFSGWDRVPSRETLEHFSGYWNKEEVRRNNTLQKSCKKYSLRPFLTASALLDKELTRELARVGGGGTRLRPELFSAFSEDGTFGIAVSPSPKDQHDCLKQFSSFCWHYPDNDLCRRGSSRIYCNQLIDQRTGERIDNVTDDIVLSLLRTFGYSGELPLRDTLVFYVYAILCSRLYLDAFEGALFTVSRADQSPRIPFVADREVYDKIVSLGMRLADLESDSYEPGNHLDFDYVALSVSLPEAFELQLTDDMFDRENETVTLSARNGDKLVIPCPCEIQDINIGGYDVVKNAWLKFYSYDYMHCPFDETDLENFLSLLNRLKEYLMILDDLDDAVRCILDGRYELICPAFQQEG